MKTIRQIRDDAATLLETVGWCQGVFRKVGDKGVEAYCMIGACREAAGYYAYDYDAAYADAAVAADLAAHAAHADASDAADAARWNDTPGRTKEEVIAALRRLDP